MEHVIIWALGAVATLSSGGFIFLLGRLNEERNEIMTKVDENAKIVNALGKEVDSNCDAVRDMEKKTDEISSQIAVVTKDVEGKPSFRYVNDEFYKKEMAKIQFDNITEQMRTLISTIEKLAEKIDKANHRAA